MNALVLAANLFGWPLVQISIGSVAVRLPRSVFDHDNWLTALRSWERGGRIYRDRLAIRKWKSRLPDGAPWLGGSAKKQMVRRNPPALYEFIVETRRAEIAHWAMLCCAPLFFLWNPFWACIVMVAYALVANLPCIVAQRYNRITLVRALRPAKRARHLA